MLATLRKINTYRNLSWYTRHRKRLESFKNTHMGEDCVIIGNGPSLNKMDLNVLKDYHTFGLNKIYLIEDRGIDLDLSYLVATNPLVIEQSMDKYDIMSCPIFLSYENTPPSKRADRHNYFITYGERIFEPVLTQPLNAGGTVTYVAMQIAFYMGFKNVYLIGVDHSFKQQGKPNETQILNKDDDNHFDPNYFKGQKWQLADIDRSEESYLLAKTAFEQANRNIFDATVGGHLDIFTKVDFKDALASMKKK